jgi:Na+/melibiose symporter-like transporter
MPMAVVEFKRLNRQMLLYRVVQTILVALLVFMAMNYQNLFTMRGKPEQFVSSLVLAIIVQLLLIYPIYKLAWRDAGIEIEGLATNLAAEQQAALRKKRLIGDLWKFCAVGFFIVFVALIPDAKTKPAATFFLATTIFSFLLTCLMYFQCFNFSAKKQMKDIK